MRMTKQIERLTNAEAAKRLRKAAAVHAEFAAPYKAGGEYAHEDYAGSMIEMYEDDYHALMVIAGMIEDGELRMAFDETRNLDTACREEIPADVYVHIGGELLADWEFIK